MRDTIGGYRCLTPMQTAGSGSAHWCMAMRGLERYFLKEFLAPVYPVNADTVIGRRQMERCLRFEQKKQRLYSAASCVIGNVLVPVIDFFRENGHYYAVSEAAPDGCPTAEAAMRMTEKEKKKLLYELSLCLQRLHAQEIVHADLKPEHIFLMPQDGVWKPRLIDLDSGFLLDDPPQSEQELEGDPAYLAPEMFLYMVQHTVRPDAAVDTFAFGAIIHQIWSGALPGFDHEHYHYLYEAALDGAEIHLKLPAEWKTTVQRMLNARPEDRPSDAEVTLLFTEPSSASERAQPARNGLSRLMKA